MPLEEDKVHKASQRVDDESFPLYDPLVPYAYARDVQCACDALEADIAEENRNVPIPKQFPKMCLRFPMAEAYDRGDKQTCKELQKSLE